MNGLSFYPGDTFGMMSGNLTPERKLLCAIENNMLVAFKDLMEGPDGSYLANSILIPSSKQMPLHVCTNKKNKEMIKILLKKGANPVQKDGHGYSSLELALGHSDLTCLWLILEAIPSDELFKNVNKQMFLSDFAFKVLMGCTMAPCLFYWNNPYELLSFDLQCLYCVTYNELPYKSKIFSIDDKPMLIKWFHRWECQVKSLKHLSRCAIRRYSKFNVCNYAAKLPLPESLKRYLIDFSDCMEIMNRTKTTK